MTPKQEALFEAWKAALLLERQTEARTAELKAAWKVAEAAYWEAEKANDQALELLGECGRAFTESVKGSLA